MKHYVLRLKSFLAENERVLMPLFLLLGFVVDGITLRRVDLLPETILVYAYLTLSGGALLIAHMIQAGVFKGNVAERLEPFLPLAMSYAFGSLFSAYAVFYAKSALIGDSWPFIAMLAFMVVGLEIFKQYRARLIFNLSVFFLAIFSFSIFSVPLWVGELGTDVFLMSVVVAVIIFVLYCFLLYASGRHIFMADGNVRNLIVSVAGITLAMTVFYMTNLLPPIPLALKDIGVYHYVAKDGIEYRTLGETTSLWDRMFGVTIHWVKNEPLYVFSSVFTPVAIQTDVAHRWEYWSTLKNDWVYSSDVSFPLEGGRDQGYRGYSFKRGLFPGKWRVTVETPAGLKIGRIEFTVVEVLQVPQLMSEIR